MEDTKERILRAALELFAAKGYSAASTKTIARAASVNEVTLFRLFGSKRNLYLAVYQRFSIKIDKQAILGDIQYELEHDLVAIGRAFVSVYNRTSKLVRMSMKDIKEEFGEIDDDLKEQIDILQSTLECYLETMSRKGLLQKDPLKLARILTGMLYGYALHLSKADALDWLESDIVELMDSITNGIIQR